MTVVSDLLIGLAVAEASHLYRIYRNQSGARPCLILRSIIIGCIMYTIIYFATMPLSRLLGQWQKSIVGQNLA